MKTGVSTKYLIFQIKGGLGKSIAATSLVDDIKKYYPDRSLIIVASYPEVFMNNPCVDRVYRLGQTTYFWEDYIEGKDTIVFAQEPYDQTGHILKKDHLIQTWCSLLSIPYTGQTPKVYVNYTQRKTADMWKRAKPVLVLQTCGGALESSQSYTWSRDMPPEVADRIVKVYSNDYHILHITRPSGYVIQGVERIDYQLHPVEMFGMLVCSSKRFLIDSCLQHAAAAFNLPSTVYWIATSPLVYGYDIHLNVTAKRPVKANQLINSYLFDYQFDQNNQECPYLDIHEMFDLEDLYI